MTEGPCRLVAYARLIGISYTISQCAAGTTMSADVALLLGGAVLAANLVHPPLKLFTSPVQFDTQVEPVPILADSGR